MSSSSSRSRIAPSWQLQDAKARFSELFKRVRAQGPQRVVKQGGEAVVIVAAEEFDLLSQRASQPATLVDFFQSAPKSERPLYLTRKRDATRNIKW